ncbi:PTS transporter subunit EIIB, partial [Sansalvadorimonas verongulae]|uniref:PTS transporter subunit EIIB n=1 Tax=Sansalvadorimonas verongulae TaxID=2172824 RepID=UPI0018AD289A
MEALPLFQQLYEKYSGSFTDEKNNGLALGRLLQAVGGTGNLKTALNIFTRLRTRAAGGKANTPCENKDIELTLGR